MYSILFISLLATLLEAASVPCGVQLVAPVETRIVGGVPANPGSWPWMVMFVDDMGYIAGSGVIINNNVILTAAQLFESIYHSLYDLDLSYWRVYAGEHDITVTDPHEMYYHIRRVVLHPGYNASSLQHDLALVFTSDTIAYNNHTRPVCLPDASHVVKTGQTCYLPGWGGTRGRFQALSHASIDMKHFFEKLTRIYVASKGSGNEEVLNQVDLPVLEDYVCHEHWDDYLPETELCAGHEHMGKDFCADDLGSPLMCKNPENGVWYAQGIAAGGGNCTLADEPGVFEDVNVYFEWILTTLEDAGYPYEY